MARIDLDEQAEHTLRTCMFGVENRQLFSVRRCVWQFSARLLSQREENPMLAVSILTVHKLGQWAAVELLVG